MGFWFFNPPEPRSNATRRWTNEWQGGDRISIGAHPPMCGCHALPSAYSLTTVGGGHALAGEHILRRVQPDEIGVAGNWPTQCVFRTEPISDGLGDQLRWVLEYHYGWIGDPLLHRPCWSVYIVFEGGGNPNDPSFYQTVPAAMPLVEVEDFDVRTGPLNTLGQRVFRRVHWNSVDVAHLWDTLIVTPYYG